jgi:hypothetical protein
MGVGKGVMKMKCMKMEREGYLQKWIVGKIGPNANVQTTRFRHHGAHACFKLTTRMRITKVHDLHFPVRSTGSRGYGFGKHPGRKFQRLGFRTPTLIFLMLIRRLVRVRKEDVKRDMRSQRMKISNILKLIVKCNRPLFIDREFKVHVRQGKHRR